MGVSVHTNHADFPTDDKARLNERQFNPTTPDPAAWHISPVEAYIWRAVVCVRAIKTAGLEPNTWVELGSGTLPRARRVREDNLDHTRGLAETGDRRGPNESPL